MTDLSSRGTSSDNQSDDTPDVFYDAISDPSLVSRSGGVSEVNANTATPSSNRSAARPIMQEEALEERRNGLTSHNPLSMTGPARGTMGLPDC